MGEPAAELHRHKRVGDALGKVVFVRVELLDPNDFPVVQVAVVGCHFLRFRVYHRVLDNPGGRYLAQKRFNELRKSSALLDELHLVQSAAVVHVHVDCVDGFDVCSIRVWISVEIG